MEVTPTRIVRAHVRKALTPVRLKIRLREIVVLSILRIIIQPDRRAKLNINGITGTLIRITRTRVQLKQIMVIRLREAVGNSRAPVIRALVNRPLWLLKLSKCNLPIMDKDNIKVVKAASLHVRREAVFRVRNEAHHSLLPDKKLPRKQKIPRVDN
jgi:hypothetical protein